MEKPFKTIAEQVEILESRGLATDALTSQILEREGYYQVVNGYKDPFLDPAATEAAGEDRYRPGTSFADLYRLFSFDRDLRDALMESFAKAEATLKAVCAHRFTEAHQDEVNPYLSEQNYSEAAQADGSARNLIAELEKAIGLRHGETRWRRKSYLVHYVQDHDGEIPLWVLTNYLTLGQTFKIFDLQPEGMRNRIAATYSRLYAETHEEPVRVQPHRLRLTYDHVKDFRNICAHDERLYCSKVSPSRDVGIVRTVTEMGLVLTRQDYARLGESLRSLLRGVTRDLPAVSDALLASMEVEDIDALFPVAP